MYFHFECNYYQDFWVYKKATKSVYYLFKKEKIFSNITFVI